MFTPNNNWALCRVTCSQLTPFIRRSNTVPIKHQAFSACLNLPGWWGGAGGWLRAAGCHSACGPLLWWVHSASGHKELMAAWIMQWHARRLSPLLPSFLPPEPSFKRADAKWSIPARFHQMHLNAVAALRMLWQRHGNKTGILFHSEDELPPHQGLTPAPQGGELS